MQRTRLIGGEKGLKLIILLKFSFSIGYLNIFKIRKLINMYI